MGNEADIEIEISPDATPEEVAAVREAHESIKRESLKRESYKQARREACKSEGSGGGLRGLVPAAALRQMAKLLDRGDGGDHDEVRLI